MEETSNPTVGIVTGEAAPALTDDGKALVAALERDGVDAEPVVWTNQERDYTTFDALLLRSCWRYFEQPDRFRVWLDSVEEAVDLVLNHTDVVRWNMKKSYLTELARAGVSTAPTAYIERESETELSAICEREGWESVVVKPAVGTSSEGIWRASTPVSAAEDRRFASEAADTDLLVQQFLPEIEDGERSLVFFGGEFSHAYRRTPDEGDFRAHPNFGASLASIHPTEGVRETAAEILSTAGQRLNRLRDEFVYARVDGVIRDGSFVLLELIEPYLRLKPADGAVQRFATAIATRVKQAGKTAQRG